MTFIKTIPNLSANKTTVNIKKNIINTTLSIDNLETLINDTLDKHNETCKYYINCDEAYWCVSFNVGLDQLEAMTKTMFYIMLYEESNKITIVISDEVAEHSQWDSVYKYLILHLCKC